MSKQMSSIKTVTFGLQKSNQNSTAYKRSSLFDQKHSIATTRIDFKNRNLPIRSRNTMRNLVTLFQE